MIFIILRWKKLTLPWFLVFLNEKSWHYNDFCYLRLKKADTTMIFNILRWKKLTLQWFLIFSDEKSWHYNDFWYSWMKKADTTMIFAIWGWKKLTLQWFLIFLDEKSWHYNDYALESWDLKMHLELRFENALAHACSQKSDPNACWFRQMDWRRSNYWVQAHCW